MSANNKNQRAKLNRVTNELNRIKKDKVKFLKLYNKLNKNYRNKTNAYNKLNKKLKIKIMLTINLIKD